MGELETDDVADAVPRLEELVVDIETDPSLIDCSCEGDVDSLIVNSPVTVGVRVRSGVSDIVAVTVLVGV